MKGTIKLINRTKAGIYNSECVAYLSMSKFLVLVSGDK